MSALFSLPELPSFDAVSGNPPLGSYVNAQGQIVKSPYTPGNIVPDSAYSTPLPGVGVLPSQVPANANPAPGNAIVDGAKKVAGYLALPLESQIAITLGVVLIAVALIYFAIEGAHSAVAPVARVAGKAKDLAALAA